MSGLHAYKGHGTHNDFVLLDDRTGTLDLTGAVVRGLTDRRGGLGGDGLIRLAPTRAMAENDRLALGAADPEWFMDYRNADGSVAEMCGNGVRVFAALAERLGLHDFAAAPLEVGTRAGVRTVRRTSGGWFTVGMGVGTYPASPEFRRGGADSTVVVDGLGPQPRAALSVDMGNPHTVVALADQDELAAAVLLTAPLVDPTPPDGTNVELVVALGEHDTPDGPVGRAVMRVHERGVGETLSCGTGACAVALALRTWAGPGAPDRWDIGLPGGQVRVTVLADGSVELSGPAVLVAEATIDLGSLDPR